MRKLKMLLLSGAAAMLGACSGGSDNTLTGGGGGGDPTDPGGQPVPQVATLTLLTSSPQMPSDGSADATISALVRDSNNNVMEEVPVVFATDSGSLAVSQPGTTDANGLLTATLSTAGDPTNRTITVTGMAGNIESTVTVNVIGTELTINGPSSLPLSFTGNYTAVLTNAGGTGISNTPVTITSANGNGISEGTVTTNALGEAAFTVTAQNGGADTITAEALGVQVTKPVTVSPDSFSFSTPEPPPAAVPEIALGAAQTVTVNWATNGAAVQGRDVTFSTTRGTVAASPVTTDASGNASTTVTADTAGPALITATNDDGTSIQLTVEFVATTPATLELQANPFTIPTNDQSAITAIVRDANGNLVKNQIVVFSLTDNTGGSLSVAQSETNSQGRAQTFYTASSTTSAVDGVEISASVQGFPAAADTVNLTVAQREVFISIGTGNEIDEPNTAQYRKEWVIQVTDAQGNGVDGVNVSTSVLSERYWDGERIFLDPPGLWVTRRGLEAFPHNGVPVAATHPSGSGCIDEDFDRNGILDPGVEDINGNLKIEAGNIAAAVAQGGGSTVTTDANGFAILDVFYPQEYAYWVEVTLEARTSVQGTESSASTTFTLPGAADDFGDEDTAPPGIVSPFGTDGVCETPPPPDGP